MTVHWTPATAGEIEDQVVRITGTMPPPRGMDSGRLLDGYQVALQAFPAAAIRTAVDGFLSGRFEEDFSLKWCPMPPELASMVRKCLTEATKPESAGRSYRYAMPRSPVLKAEITRDFARRLHEQRVVPRGCIWVPGTASGDNPRIDIGTLFAPDPTWEGAQVLGAVRSEEASDVDTLTETDRARLAAYRDRLKRMGVL